MTSQVHNEIVIVGNDGGPIVGKGWITALENNAVIIMPINDSMPHYRAQCTCGVRTEIEGNKCLQIHNAFDGRTTGDAARRLD